MKVKKMILFLSVAMLLAGCNKDNAPVAVSEVTLSRTALTMTVGDTENLQLPYCRSMPGMTALYGAATTRPLH